MMVRFTRYSICWPGSCTANWVGLRPMGHRRTKRMADAVYVPISNRIEKMQYGGEYPINDTLLSYSGEQLRTGIPCNDVIEDCMARAHKAYEEIPVDPQERPIWDWTKMRHQIEAMVYGYIEKNHKDEPRVIETLPAGMLEKWRKIESSGGSPTFRKRRHWGVEDTGPADPLPIMDAPPSHH